MEQRSGTSVAGQEANEWPRDHHERRTGCDVDHRERAPRDGGWLPRQLPVDRRPNEDRIVQSGPLLGAERCEEIDDVRDDEDGAEQHGRDHDAERDPGQRHCGCGEHAEPQASPPVPPLGVEKMDSVCQEIPAL